MKFLCLLSLSLLLLAARGAEIEEEDHVLIGTAVSF